LAVALNAWQASTPTVADPPFAAEPAIVPPVLNGLDRVVRDKIPLGTMRSVLSR